MHQPARQIVDALATLDTPCLLLDRARLEANARRSLDIADRHGVALRPHLKTSKSEEVARILTGGRTEAPVTVSTLAEAEYFASAGFGDILYAVGMAPGKFERVARLVETTGARVTLLTDNLALSERAPQRRVERGGTTNQLAATAAPNTL